MIQWINPRGTDDQSCNKVEPFAGERSCHGNLWRRWDFLWALKGDRSGKELGHWWGCGVEGGEGPEGW